LMSTDTAGTVDWMSAGATLTLSLASNGTVAGHLFMPSAGESGADLDADNGGLMGARRRTRGDGTDGNTFVRDMTWKPLLGGLLAAEKSFNGTLLRVQIQK